MRKTMNAAALVNPLVAIFIFHTEAHRILLFLQFSLPQSASEVDDAF